jgi:hypothetical protein
VTGIASQRALTRILNFGARRLILDGQKLAPARLGREMARKILVVVASLVLGIACAVGHHLFYAYWDGRAVPTQEQQQFILFGGTAFAFLVKLFLSIATGAAYIQQFWQTVRRKPLRLERIDLLNSVLGDLTSLRDVALWFSVPLLTLIMGVTW